MEPAANGLVSQESTPCRADGPVMTQRSWMTRCWCRSVARPRPARAGHQQRTERATLRSPYVACDALSVAGTVIGRARHCAPDGAACASPCLSSARICLSVSPLSPAYVSQLSPACVSPLSPACVSPLSPAYVSQLSPACVSQLSPACVSQLSPACASPLSPACTPLVRVSRACPD